MVVALQGLGLSHDLGSRGEWLDSPGGWIRTRDDRSRADMPLTINVSVIIQDITRAPKS
jgi:hypothetical protein